MAEAVIRTEKLVHTYPRGNVTALKGVDLEIYAGDVVSIVGQNGSGKTTLVRHFNGLLRPTSGKVYLLGEDTTGQTVAQMSRKCGYVFQNPNHQIFCTTVEEELMVAPKNFGFTPQEAKESLDRVCQLMDLGRLLQKHPMTLDYTTKKIVTIASVLVFRPQVLVLDEPTGGLDEVGRRMLTKIIRMMHEERHTVVIISHDMDYVAENSSRVIAMAQGEILSDAPPERAFLDTGPASLPGPRSSPPKSPSWIWPLPGAGTAAPPFRWSSSSKNTGRPKPRSPAKGCANPFLRRNEPWQ